MKLQDKVAIVTGGGRGIGRASALALAKEGAAVVTSARTGLEIEEVAREVRELGSRAISVEADLSREADIANVVTETLGAFGRVDILVNNAGINLPLRSVMDFTLEDWDRMMQVNLTGPFLCCKAVLPIMMRQQSGKIINISSLGGQIGIAGNSAYGASKAALINFALCLAAEVKQYGIDVNTVCPSGTDTRLLHDIGRGRGRTNLMSPEEIAAVVLFLASPDSSAITGTAIGAYGLSNPLFGPLFSADDTSDG
jgi:NAD(P)-dependent dehydrogenase (short-subunit alcohol dehydrogenase family)